MAEVQTQSVMHARQAFHHCAMVPSQKLHFSASIHEDIVCSSKYNRQNVNVYHHNLF